MRRNDIVMVMDPNTELFERAEFDVKWSIDNLEAIII